MPYKLVQSERNSNNSDATTNGKSYRRSSLSSSGVDRNLSEDPNRFALPLNNNIDNNIRDNSNNNSSRRTFSSRPLSSSSLSLPYSSPSRQDAITLRDTDLARLTAKFDERLEEMEASFDEKLKNFGETIGSIYGSLSGKIIELQNTVNDMSAEIEALKSGGTLSTVKHRKAHVTLTPAKKLLGHERGVRQIKSFSHEGELFLVTSGYESSIKIWNLTRFEPTETLTGHTGAVYSLAVYDNTYLVSGGQDCKIRLWDLKTKIFLGKLGSHNSVIYALKVFQNEENNWLLASGAGDKWVKIWDLTNRKLLRKIFFGDNVNSLEMFAAKKGFVNLAVGGASDPVKISCSINEDTNKEAISKLLPDVNEDGVTESMVIFVKKDGEINLASGHDCTIRLWDVSEKHTLLGTWGGHQGAVKALAVLSHESLDRIYLLSGCDNKIMCWDVSIQRIVCIVQCDSPIHSLKTFVNNGKTWLCSGHWNGTIQLYDLKIELNES